MAKTAHFDPKAFPEFLQDFGASADKYPMEELIRRSTGRVVSPGSSKNR
jgi:hypothetical protein